ncbi:hypothetical protein SAY87_003302 [Trapa incisa]|uniref:Homeobox domain-containing protein n=1 Tax=Trapa incisa TaxID=236973 RepID=A0AAN7KJ35_9MYRT|nr:hypothetical protein SAY87_003302 [Trapa incisa]
MWMMGYNDDGDLYMADSFNGQKLHPLAPSPISSVTLNYGSNGHVISSPPLPNPNHIEQGKREFNPHQVMVSSRWNPTPEQLRTLEDLYRHGMRTPSADQIQQITAQLRRYGKIEGKNVFYWFQNHKARERQKRRRQMESSNHHNTDGVGHLEVEIIGRKDTGDEGACNKTMLGGVDDDRHGQTNKDADDSNNWAPPPMNCSTPSEEPATSTAMKKEAKRDGGENISSSHLEHCQWMKINGNGENHSRKDVIKTWQPMVQHHLLSYPPAAHLINTPIMDPRLVNINKPLSSHHLTSFLIAPAVPAPPLYTNLMHEDIFINSHLLDEEDEEEDNSQTLQLFPLRSGESYTKKKETEMSVSLINSSATHPHQFFEFLPLKN